MQLRDKRLMATAAIAVALGFGIGQPAQANDVLNYLERFFGGVNNNVNYSEAQRMTELDNQRAHIDSRIATELSAGRITPAQASEFHAQLRENNSLQFQFADDGRFSFSDNERVMAGLNGIQSRLNASVTSNVVVAPRAGFGIAPRGFVNRRGVEDAQARVAKRLDRGLASGRLTRGEFQSLKGELNMIAARKAQMSNSNGFLSFRENQSLLSRLARLDDRCRLEMNDAQIAGRDRPWY